MTEPQLEVKMHGAWVEVSKELLNDGLPSFQEIVQQAEESARAFRALPPEERERILAERERILAEQKAAYEAERCTACGCHPDEHRDG